MCTPLLERSLADIFFVVIRFVEIVQIEHKLTIVSQVVAKALTIDDFPEYYSKDIVGIVCNLLKFSPDLRPTAEEGKEYVFAL